MGIAIKTPHLVKRPGPATAVADFPFRVPAVLAAAMLVRGPMTTPSVDALVAAAPGARPELVDAYGLDTLLGASSVSSLVLVGILLLITVVFGTLGTWRIGRMVG